MAFCAGSEDEAAGVCSRDLVQLSQNLEIILSPGEKGYDFLVVDRNGNEKPAQTLYGGNTYQLYVADLYNNPPPGLTNITITGGGGCSSYQRGDHGAIAQQQCRRCLQSEFCRRYRY